MAIASRGPLRRLRAAEIVGQLVRELGVLGAFGVLEGEFGALGRRPDVLLPAPVRFSKNRRLVHAELG